MRTIFLILAIAISAMTYSQELPTDIANAIKSDDSTELSKNISQQTINSCYGYYGLLSETVRINAKNCFYFLLNNGANVNAVCSGYIPPLMHAAKYGNLEMVKALVGKGANIHYRYQGSLHFQNGPEQNETPISYAEKYGRTDIVDYLRSIK